MLFSFRCRDCFVQILLCHVLPYFIKRKQKGPHHIHSWRSRCFTKKSVFNVAGNLVIVVKFTFQIVFGNSRQNPRHVSARGRDESLELHSILWSDWRTSKQKVYVTEIVLSLMFADVIFRRERNDYRKYVCGSQANRQLIATTHFRNLDTNVE